ncbi:helix-turn-helix transcriptional regulator [Kitasatospora sp. NPDC048545]|uniref:telomere-associated protein Tap n=1 Tax=Kitasatospora sp. NPDC048545 TaxID=3157208 RepID=UPI00340CA30B
MTATPPNGFEAIDALLGTGPRRPVPLPAPGERARLRTEYGLSKTETAKALGISVGTFTAWESGQRDPQGEGRAAYAKLLEGIVARLAPAALAEAAEPAEPAEAPRAVAAPPEPATAPAVAPTQTPAPAPAPMPMLDQNPDGSLVMAPAAPCVQCGQPSVYRAQGHPMHLGGFCRPGAVPVAEPAAPESPAASGVPARPVASVASVAAPRQATPSAAPAAAPRRAAPARPGATPSRARKAPPAASKAPARTDAPSDWEAAAAARFPAGPLAVLDVAPSGKALVAYLADGGEAATAPAGRTLADVVEWALETRLGSPRLHRHGKDGDALVVLTDAALAELGLPPLGRDEKKEYVPRLGRLPKTHKAVKQIEKAGWLLTQRGLGPWARIYRTPEDGRRQCVQLCIPAWGALTSGGWQLPDGLDTPGLARLLGTYATRVLTPRGSTAVSGLELVTALRPPTRAVRTEGGWTSGPVEGSRTRAFDPAPPEVPDVHPLAQGREPGGELVTEAWDWHRPLTDREAAAPYAVGLDVNMAFLAAAGRLTLPLSGPVHERDPAFDKKIPGSWLVDLSHIDTDPLLPSPFTPDGSRPTGPAWYTTVKVAYALELGGPVRPSEGWLRHEHGPYLDPWHKHLRRAYVDTMAALGVPLDLADTDPFAFLDAMAAVKATGDPAELAVLTAIKATAKGTIGKLRERPRGHGYKPGERWPALERPTWDPLMRALVIDTATVNLHRKLRRTAADTGLHAIAVLSDCAVYASPGPDAPDVLTTPDGTLTTALRLGVSPGLVKFEGSRPMAEIAELIADGANPARHIKAGGVVSADE